MKKLTKNVMTIVVLIAGITSSHPLLAQTDMDAILLNKKQFCQAISYDYSSWDHYWEGTFKRNNQNIGSVSTQSVMYMPNYGITNNLNVMASVPYVWTNATRGTLHGINGFQDLGLAVKWKAVTIKTGKSKFSLFAVGDFSTPLTNYVIDYLPLAIGMGTTDLTARGMIDYRYGRFTITGSAAYTWRNNVKLDRPSYFDTELHFTNEVRMPNTSLYQLRTGYRGKYLIAEATLTKMKTLGGFDIRKNDMPFSSNRMNATMVGVEASYSLKKVPGLSLTASGHYTISGRNVGQSKAFSAGGYYVFYWRKKKKS